jgi:hypothetical protein
MYTRVGNKAKPEVEILSRYGKCKCKTKCLCFIHVDYGVKVKKCLGSREAIVASSWPSHGDVCIPYIQQG